MNASWIPNLLLLCAAASYGVLLLSFAARSRSEWPHAFAPCRA
jgi:hypothetical protein